MTGEILFQAGFEFVQQYRQLGLVPLAFGRQIDVDHVGAGITQHLHCAFHCRRDIGAFTQAVAQQADARTP